MSLGAAWCKQACHFVNSSSDAEFYSQHSRTWRAHEAAHGDVGVSNPGLAALETVFVYSGLGQLSDLAGADLLVVPVLSVRHFYLFSFKKFDPVAGRQPSLNHTPRSASTTGSTSRPHYAENTRSCGSSLSGRLRGGEARQAEEVRAAECRKCTRGPSK